MELQFCKKKTDQLFSCVSKGEFWKAVLNFWLEAYLRMKLYQNFLSHIIFRYLHGKSYNTHNLKVTKTCLEECF